MKRIPRNRLKPLAPLAVLFATIGGPLHAEWQLITDFTTEAREDLYVWTRFGYGDIYLDGLDPTNFSNRALYMDTGPPDENRGNIMYMGLPVPDGGVAPAASASLKYDFYTYGSAFQFLLGLSDVPITVDESLSLAFGRMLTPNAWGDYEAVARQQITFDARSGNEYLVSDIPVPVNEWMTIYMYVDNATDTYEVFVKRQEDSVPFQLIINNVSQFAFRNGTEDPLPTIMLAAGRGTGDIYPDAWVVDNIYMDMSGRNAEIPDSIGPIKTEALGYPLQDGYINTENWLGWMYGLTDPYFWNLTWNNWCYVDEAAFNQESGGWVFFYFGDQAWENWDIRPDGNVDTGNFMSWIYIDETSDYVYSYLLSRWVYMPQPAAGNAGAWAFVTPLSTIPSYIDYAITPTGIAPFIDGIAGDGEWANALVVNLTYDALVTNGDGYSRIDDNAGSPQPDATRAEGQAFVTSTAHGLYLGFNITDADLNAIPGYGVAGNNYDGVQLGIDVNPSPTDRTSTLLLDINPVVDVDGVPAGSPNVYARWAITGWDPAWGVQASATLTDTGYFIEMEIPWAFVTSFGVDNPLTEGAEFRLSFNLMDYDQNGEQRELLWDSTGIGNAANWPFAAIVEDLPKVPMSYSIPKVTTVPTVDGVIGDGEWLYAAYTEASYDNWVARSAGTSEIDIRAGTTSPDAPRAEGQIYLAATDEALYMGAIIVDPFVYIDAEFGTASNNNDGVQLALDLNPDPTNRNTSVLWDFTAATMASGVLAGPANIFARWGITSGFPDTTGYEASWGVQAAGNFTANGYIIEVKMPWQVMRDLGFSNPLDAGSKFTLGFIVVDILEDGTRNELLVDFGNGLLSIGNSATWNEAVLDD